MRKIVDYVIIGDTLNNISDKVNLRIKNGWRPFGSPYILIANDIPWHYQAMVKYSDE